MDAEEAINFFTENIESGQGKSAMALLGTPGTSLFVDLGGTAVWGQKWVPSQGRHFAVAGAAGTGILWEVFANKTKISRGNVAIPNGPVTMACNPTQLLICSGGLLYIFTFSTNVLAAVASPPFGKVAQVDYSDGFFIATQSSPAAIALSNINDGTVWAGTAISTISLFPDNLVSMKVIQSQIVLNGNTKSTVYQNAGVPLFPFQPVSGAVIEHGAWAQNATVVLDSSVMWLQADDRGQLVAMRNSGYNAVRISNHAMEQWWQSFPIANDAIGYSLQINGHPWWHLYFPTANLACRYDVSTQMWHKVLAWDTNNGTWVAHQSQNHADAFGKHLLGAWDSGHINETSMPTYTGGSWNFCTDDGSVLRRIRRTPYIQTETQRIFHNRLQFELQTGLGPIPSLTDNAGNPRPPQLTVRWSDDGARTWSNDHPVNCGAAGEYTARAFVTRLGSTLHGRVYEADMSDPIPWYFSDAYLDADPAFKPSQRLADRLKGVA